jgi:hypothetical protein
MGRIPSNHRLAERKLITLVQSGEWEIDKQGRIWRLSVRRGLKTGGSHLIPTNRCRVEKLLPSGYLFIRATIDGVRINGLAHRLVWQHYHGNIPEGMIVNHKNGLKDDNYPDNLIPSTYSDNAIHAHKGGLIDQYGQKNPAVKLTDREVAQIRMAYVDGRYTMKELAKRFKVTFQTISRIVRGKERQRQGGPIQERDLRHSVCDRDAISGRFVSKKKAGRELDGRTWGQFPTNKNE